MGYEYLILSTLRQNIHATFYTFINANKPGGWTVLAKEPNVTTSFPCIVISPPKPAPFDGTANRAKFRFAIPIKVTFINLEKNGMESIDSAKDTICNAVLTNHSTLRSYGLLLNDDDAYTEEDNDTDIFGDETVNVGELTFNFERESSG